MKRASCSPIALVSPGSWYSPCGFLHAMAWLAAQGPASEIAQPAKVDQAARRS